MARTSTQEKVFQFSHTTTSSYTSDATQSSNWLTEVFSSGTDFQDSNLSSDGEHETSSSYTSPPSSHSETTPPPGTKGVVAVSFVNLTGAPTKDGRNKARKIATAARKEEKKARLRRDQREAILVAVSVPSDHHPSTPRSKKTTANLNYNSSLVQVSRFSSSRLDPFIKYPFDLSHREKRLIDHIFYEESGTIKPYKEAFFPVGLTDVAAFHQVIANLAVQLDVHRHPGFAIAEYEKAEVVAHHAKALAIVHKRLSNPIEATSQGTLGTVIAMACYSHLVKDFTAWHAHINGLRQLLKLQRDLQRSSDQFTSLRFGFHGLDTLLGPALSWVDMNGCASQDIPPRFPISPYAAIFPPENLQLNASSYVHQLSDKLYETFPSGKEIFTLLKDTAVFATVFNAELRHQSFYQITQDPMWPWTHLYPLAHNLLSYRSAVDVDDYESVVKECCRLGLSIFVTQMRRQFGIAPMVLNVFAEQLLPLLRNPNVPSDWGQFEALKLWILVVGAMEAQKDARIGILDLLVDVVGRLGIKNHSQLEKKVKEFIWVDAVDGVRFWDFELELWGIDEVLYD